jgi:hypothetical protein
MPIMHALMNHRAHQKGTGGIRISTRCRTMIVLIIMCRLPTRWLRAQLFAPPPQSPNHHNHQDDPPHVFLDLFESAEYSIFWAHQPMG